MKKDKKRKTFEDNIIDGTKIVRSHPLFGKMYDWDYRIFRNNDLNNYAYSEKSYVIYLNACCDLSPKQWAYMIIHNILHFSFGHYNLKKFNLENVNQAIWNQACDIYITQFLKDIHLGGSISNQDVTCFPISIKDEVEVYKYLMEYPNIQSDWIFSTCIGNDMKKFNIRYEKDDERFERQEYDFTNALRRAAHDSVTINDDSYSEIQQAKSWFVSNYPLFGAIASGFEIIEDRYKCEQYDIKIAAVDCVNGKIYVNNSASLDENEWKFVLAHEYLHAGLNHDSRQKGRDPFLWNVACDYVINDWLDEMKIGSMPNIGVLYDASLHGMSAEEVYDLIIKDMKRFMKSTTFRGLKQSDIIFGNYSKNNSVDLSEFYRNALKEGLDYQKQTGRGFIPAGLVEEIMSLTMPAISWEVKLAEWLDQYILDNESKRTYSRLSRRQASTPNIIRPAYVKEYTGNTFGVIIDTSGSMSVKMIGQALGSIVSYAISKDVHQIRVVYCDAKAYDAGYLSPDELVGNVEVKGRGGTILQPAIDLLQEAKDFPSDAPVLIITDGGIENKLHIKFEHAFLLPNKCKLPFHTKSEVFNFK